MILTDNLILKESMDNNVMLAYENIQNVLEYLKEGNLTNQDFINIMHDLKSYVFKNDNFTFEYVKFNSLHKEDMLRNYTTFLIDVFDYYHFFDLDKSLKNINVYKLLNRLNEKFGLGFRINKKTFVFTFNRTTYILNNNKNTLNEYYIDSLKNILEGMMSNSNYLRRFIYGNYI